MVKTLNSMNNLIAKNWHIKETGIALLAVNIPGVAR